MLTRLLSRKNGIYFLSTFQLLSYKGFTSQDMYKLGLTTGVQQRQVCLEIPKGSLALVRQLPGMEDFDPDIHVLQMLKGGFGLKDAPRVWRIRLGQVWEHFGLKPVQADKSIYCKWQACGWGNLQYFHWS